MSPDDEIEINAGSENPDEDTGEYAAVIIVDAAVIIVDAGVPDVRGDDTSSAKEAIDGRDDS